MHGDESTNKQIQIEIVDSYLGFGYDIRTVIPDCFLAFLESFQMNGGGFQESCWQDILVMCIIPFLNLICMEGRL